MMALLPPNLDYTNRDFDSLRLRLQALIRSVHPDWTDFNVANFGNILLECFCHVGDVLGKYLDANARESRFVTATQRKNVLTHARGQGYVPRGAQAATVDLALTFSPAPAGSLTIGVDATAATAEITSPALFHPVNPITVAPGLLGIIATFEHAERANESYASSGLPNQRFPLRATPYLDGSATVTATDGVYAQVDSFLDYGPAARVFVVSVDENDMATIAFGDGVEGAIPLGAITINYKTGGGANGNVDPGTVNRFLGAWTDTLGNPIRVACANALKADGGLDRETIASIKRMGPLTVRAGDRSVGRDDFETHALKVPGVARALLTTSNEDPAVPENAGVLYVVPTSGSVPSAALKASVLAQCTTAFPHTTTFTLSVQDPAYKTINVAMVVHFRPGTYPPAGALAIRTALATFFRVLLADGTPNDNIDFGLNYRDEAGQSDPAVALSDLFEAVALVPAVRKVDGKPTSFLLNGVHDDVRLLAREFPKLGAVAIIDGDTGATL